MLVIKHKKFDAVYCYKTKQNGDEMTLDYPQ